MENLINYTTQNGDKLFFIAIILIIIGGLYQVITAGKKAAIEQNDFKGIIDIPDSVKSKVKIQAGENILFCIGEIKWIASGFGYIKTPGRVIKDTVLTSKRIIIPINLFFGQSLNSIDIYYQKNDFDSLGQLKKFMYSIYWIESYSVEDGVLVLNLKGQFDTKLSLFSSVTNEIIKVISEKV